MSNVYRVNLPNAKTSVYVEANSKNAARIHAVRNTTVEKLNTGDALALVRKGTVIEKAGVEAEQEAAAETAAASADPTIAGQESLPIDDVMPAAQPEATPEPTQPQDAVAEEGAPSHREPEPVRRKRGIFGGGA